MAVILSDDTKFQSDLSANTKVIVKYFADWCGTCRLFAPKYKRLSGDEKYQNIVFLEVNAEKSPEARKMGQVKNLPTFAIFVNGQIQDSVCSSKEEAVVELLQKLS